LILRLCTDPVEQEMLYSIEWNMKQTWSYADRDWEWGSSMCMKITYQYQQETHRNLNKIALNTSECNNCWSKSRLLQIYASAWSEWTTTCVTPDSSMHRYVINIDAGCSVQVHRSVDSSIIEEVKCIWLNNSGSVITETKLYSTVINLSIQSILKSLKHMLKIQMPS
jgi:hypothetical protein